MDQPEPTTGPINEIAPPKELNFDAAKIKMMIIAVIVLIVVVLASIIGLHYYKQHQAEILLAKDKIIIQDLYQIRQDSLQFYAKNFSYKDWIPDSQMLEQIKSSGSEVVIRKPDYQNYIMYAYLASAKKYFCIDTANFADSLVQVTDKQNKCQ